MNVEPWMVVSGYFLIGIFVASVINHATCDDDFTMFVVYTLFWPIVLSFLVFIGIVCIPYILGKWTGHLIQDLVRAMK